MHAKPQFRVYTMHDLGALRRARPTAIAVPLVTLYIKPSCGGLLQLTVTN
jgi:hypothetical protein